MTWFVYMLETECGSVYTGISTDVPRRMTEHQSMRTGGKLGAKYFRSKQVKELVYLEACADRSSASKREYAIKAMTAKKKRALIAENSLKTKDLSASLFK